MAFLGFLVLFGIFATVCVVIVNRRSNGAAYGDDATRQSVRGVENRKRDIQTAVTNVQPSDHHNGGSL